MEPKETTSKPALETTASSDPLDGIEVTNEELTAAIRQIRLEKAAEIEKQQRRERQAAREAEIRRPWTSEELFNYISNRATHEYGFNLVIDDSNKLVYRMLCRYFSGDPSFSEFGDGFSLTKGILLCGPVGTGKSTVMQLFGRNKRQCYNMTSCRKVAALYAQDGHSVFEVYRGPRFEPMSDPSVFYQREIGYCFDDLGTEETKKNYGNEVNVMSEVLLNRYDQKFRYPWAQTHITTNLTTEEIESFYGSRVRSRMREMFNLIIMAGNDRRA